MTSSIMTANGCSARRTLAALFLLSMFTTTSRAVAQNSGDKDCAHAAKIIAKGHPEKKEEWALSTILRCGGAGAQALAAGMLTLRTETDTATISAFMFAADEWQDAAIYRSAVSIATDNAASAPARIFSIRHLLRLMRPNHEFDYGAISGPPSDPTVGGPNGCSGNTRSDNAPIVGQSLPASFAGDVNALGATVAANVAAPQAVRNAAQCLADAITTAPPAVNATRKRPGTPSRRP